ncbi:Manganese/iron superoxide dismutase [Mycena olivaceomarginata]|nr:Manganese/iron superoxide dismutase [Mycena olivaceomarginata]
MRFLQNRHTYPPSSHCRLRSSSTAAVSCPCPPFAFGKRRRLLPAIAGHINHSLFWKNLAPAHDKGGSGGVLKDGPLKATIDKDFGGLNNLKKEFNAATLGIQGSGWGWPSLNPTTKCLEIVTTANQDPLLTHVPLIGVIWEHAFYLQYLKVKPDNTVKCKCEMMAKCYAMDIDSV